MQPPDNVKHGGQMATEVNEVEKAATGHHDGGERSPGYDPDDIHQAALQDNPETAERLTWATILSIFFLGLSTVAPIGLGFIVISSVLVDVGTDLDDSVNTGWVLSSWSISSSVSFALAGSLSDIFGRRYVIIAGQMFGLVGAICASVAKSLSVVIGGSTLLGFSCGLVLVAYAAIPELLPNRYRGIGLAWTEGALHLPWVAVGVLIGKLFVLHSTWRWIYYIAIIYSVICLIGTGVLYFPPAPPRQDHDRSRWQEFLELDFVAIVLYSGGLTSVLLGLSWAGEEGHAWKSASVIAPIVLGALGFVAAFVYDFTFVEQTGRQALFPRDLMTRFRQYTVSLVVAFVGGMVYYSMSGLLPQGTFYVYTNKPMGIGVTQLPNGIGQVVGAVIVPLFLHKTRHPKWYIIAGVFVQTLFVGLYVYGISLHKAAWMAFQFFGQGCFALITVTTMFNASLHVRHSELGVAIGLLGTFRSMGGSVGTAIFGTILRSVITSNLGKDVAAAAVSHGYHGDMKLLIPAVVNAAVGVPGAFAAVKGVTPALEAATLAALHDAYAKAFRMVFYASIPFGVVALACAFLVEDASRYMTNHVAVHLEKDVLVRKQHDDSGKEV